MPLVKMKRYTQVIQITTIHLKMVNIWQLQFIKLKLFLVVVKHLAWPQYRILWFKLFVQISDVKNKSVQEQTRILLLYSKILKKIQVCQFIAVLQNWAFYKSLATYLAYKIQLTQELQPWSFPPVLSLEKVITINNRDFVIWYF